MDVSDEKDVFKSFRQLNSLDALIHCARVLIKRPFARMTADVWDRQIDSGLRGAFLCSREAFKLMRRRGGSIVLVSSLSGVFGAEKFPGMSAYVAAKSGLAGLTEALAVEGRERGIRVNAISPGSVDTTMADLAGVTGPRRRPVGVARTVGWLAGPSWAPPP